MMQDPIRVLVIDDDTALRGLLDEYLHKQGFVPFSVESAAAARATLATLQPPPDMVVVDVMMPDENGMEFARWFRDHGYTIPVMMLTALGDVDKRIEGLESGADDYLAKPFEPRELCLRIEKLVQRSRGKLTKVRYIRFGEFVIDCQKMELKQQDRLVALSTTEASLLVALARSLNQAIPRDLLSQQFHGISERSIDVQITRLRKKIEANPKEPIHLITVRGEGYMLRG